jgi:hypothetical protein
MRLIFIMLKFSHCLISKLRYTQLLMLVAALLFFPSVSSASDAFTGYQIDNHGQYFGFLGIRTPLVSYSPPVSPISSKATVTSSKPSNNG